MYLMQTVSTSSRGRPTSTIEYRPENFVSPYDSYKNYINLNNPSSHVHEISRLQESLAENENSVEKKKEKKWFLGGFFRRKLKREDDSSDEEDGKLNFLTRKRSHRTKRKSRANGFDVVVPQTNAKDTIGKSAEELWSGFKEPQQRYIFRQHDCRQESNLSRNSSGGSGSLDGRKGRRERMARAQAKRDQMRDGSSSDENGSGHSSSSVTREGRRRKSGRAKVPSATPSPSRSPRVHPRMPLNTSSSYPIPVMTYPPGYHWEVSHPAHHRTLQEYEQYLSACGTRNKSLSYDNDMHRAEAMFVQLPIARTRSSCIQAEAHGEVVNVKPLPPPRVTPVSNRVNSTSSLPIQNQPLIQRSASGNYFGNMYENIPDAYQSRSGSSHYLNQEKLRTNEQYSQSVPKTNFYQPPRLPSSPQADLRYYADQNPRSRNPIHITCSANPSPVSDKTYLSDSQINRKSTKEFWRQKDRELMLKKQQDSQLLKNDRSGSNSPALIGVANKPKPRQTAVLVARKIVHGIPVFPDKMTPQLVSNSQDEQQKSKTPPDPPIRRQSKIDMQNLAIKSDGVENHNNLDDALNELETIYKSLRLSEDFGTPVKNRINIVKSPDKLSDDMAIRRLTVKDSNDPKVVFHQSYLQCSAVLGTPGTSPVPSVGSIRTVPNNEPDITFDDVVFRNHRHANSHLKTPDPQPPFGIPIGPVAPAPNSDYLHVNPAEKSRNSAISSKVPDVVKDDLAFRNLRKDNLTANLPPTSNAVSGSPKKKAVRSVSENLFNLIRKECRTFLPIETNNNIIDCERTQSMTDLNENVQRDSTLLEKRLKALKEEKLAKRAEFFDGDAKNSVAALNDFNRSGSLTACRQKSTSSDTLTEETELKLQREGIKNCARLCPPATPERRHFRSPVVELSKYPAAVPATALYQNPFKEEPLPLDEVQLDDLLSTIASEAKRTSEAIGRQLVEIDVAAATDILSPERKRKLSSMEIEIRNEVEKEEVSLKNGQQVEPLLTEKNQRSFEQNDHVLDSESSLEKNSSILDSDYQINDVELGEHKSVEEKSELSGYSESLKINSSFNISQILQEVEKEHKELCLAFPNEPEDIPVVVHSQEKIDYIVNEKICERVTQLDVPIKMSSPVKSNSSEHNLVRQSVSPQLSCNRSNGCLPLPKMDSSRVKISSDETLSDPDNTQYQPISDISEIFAEEVEELPTSIEDAFQEVYEYNCPMKPPQSKDNGDEGPVVVSEEVKRILVARGRSDGDEEAGRSNRGERKGGPRGAALGGPDSLV